MGQSKSQGQSESRGGKPDSAFQWEEQQSHTERHKYREGNNCSPFFFLVNCSPFLKIICQSFNPQCIPSSGLDFEPCSYPVTKSSNWIPRRYLTQLPQSSRSWVGNFWCNWPSWGIHWVMGFCRRTSSSLETLLSWKRKSQTGGAFYFASATWVVNTDGSSLTAQCPLSAPYCVILCKNFVPECKIIRKVPTCPKVCLCLQEIILGGKNDRLWWLILSVNVAGS